MKPPTENHNDPKVPCRERTARQGVFMWHGSGKVENTTPKDMHLPCDRRHVSIDTGLFLEQSWKRRFFVSAGIRIQRKDRQSAHAAAHCSTHPRQTWRLRTRPTVPPYSDFRRITTEPRFRFQILGSSVLPRQEFPPGAHVILSNLT